ncbi:MAG TPA: FixH family protein [Verrucomicrobiota bacterium]|nr:FixH family protein [Verrucomicrobiota bacterium]
MNTSVSSSWNPWPWAIAGFLGCFFLTVVGFGVFAFRLRFDLVRPDYYEAELQHDAQRAGRERALAPGSAATVALDGAGRIDLQFPAGHAGAVSGATLRLYRPADARLDHELPLHPDPAGRQRLDTALAPGLWRAHLTWTHAGSDYLHEAVLVVPRVPVPVR